jgi:polyhydroxyalkanoate synthase
LLLVYLDWLAHLAFSPGKQQDLVRKWFRKALRLGLYTARDSLRPGSPPAIEPLPQDQRFDDPAWQRWPFNLYYQSFLLMQQWWHNATTGIRGVSRHDEQAVTFITRQLLDVLSPSNFPCSNPQVLKAALEQGGTNFLRGAANYLGDLERAALRRKSAEAEEFPVGKKVAVTPGKVVSETGSSSYCSTSRPRKPSTPSRS